MHFFANRTNLLALVAAFVCLASAEAQESNPPCAERERGGYTRNGEVWRIFRISPQIGRTCDFDMNVGGQAILRELRVTTPPAHGRLVSARPNRITYKAPASVTPETFSVALRVENLRGEGWINVAVEVVPRR